MGRSHTTLSREIKYHGSFGHTMHYSPCEANDIARMKRRKAGRKRVLDNPEIRDYVEDKIKLGWAPEIVSGRLPIDKLGYSASHETIYQYVYGQSWDLVGYLPRRHRLDQSARRSITYDNGLENARHEEINKILKTRSYFCNAYHSWEKGSVENANGLIRRYIPKKKFSTPFLPWCIRSLNPSFIKSPAVVDDCHHTGSVSRHNIK